LNAEDVEIGSELPNLVARRTAAELYAEADTAYKLALDVCDATAKQLGIRGSALQSFDAPGTPEEELQATLDERQEFLSVFNVLAARKLDLTVKLSALGGEVKQLAQSRSDACGVMNSLADRDREEYLDAQERYRVLTLKGKQQQHMQQQIAIAEAQANATQRQLEDVCKVKQQGQQTRDVVAHLTEVRNVFHRTEAPKMVSYTYVETMLGEVNEALDFFDAPFRVEMDENLGFTARFLDGVRVQPDSNLSVGERILLAMAFRITVNSTFAGQVGVLIMDEPTAGLDESNLGNLPRAIERLRDLSHERGLQVLFVTHEPRIAHHFDNVIELPAA